MQKWPISIFCYQINLKKMGSLGNKVIEVQRHMNSFNYNLNSNACIFKGSNIVIPNFKKCILIMIYFLTSNNKQNVMVQ